MTIGDIKNSSLHLSSFVMCPLFCKFFSSSSTCFSRCSGTRLPFWWTGVKFGLNCDFTIWCRERPILDVNFLYFIANSALIVGVWGVSIELMFLPVDVGDSCCVSWIPRGLHMSLPMIARCLFGTTMMSARPAFHPLHSMSQ